MIAKYFRTLLKKLGSFCLRLSRTIVVPPQKRRFFYGFGSAEPLQFPLSRSSEPAQLSREKFPFYPSGSELEGFLKVGDKEEKLIDLVAFATQRGKIKVGFYLSESANPFFQWAQNSRAGATLFIRAGEKWEATLELQGPPPEEGSLFSCGIHAAVDTPTILLSAEGPFLSQSFTWK